MQILHTLSETFESGPIDPAEGASQIGYREITGDVPSFAAGVMLLAWAVVFNDGEGSLAAYQTIVQRLGHVDGNGLANWHLSGFRADRLGNMSERTDLIGERATIWVTSTVDGGESRGAILAAVDGMMIQVLALDQYVADGDARAVRVIENTAMAMAQRQSTLLLPPTGDTMSRLPILDDLVGSLENTSIGVNRYTALPQ